MYCVTRRLGIYIYVSLVYAKPIFEKGNHMNKKPEYIEYEDGTRILLDEDDVPELTDEFFKSARRFDDALAEYSRQIKAGRPKTAAPKRVKSFKLSPDVIDAIVTSGAGYNARVEAALRQALAEGRI
jgi:uncharacterized protein (DUF4415 family)